VIYSNVQMKRWKAVSLLVLGGAVGCATQAENGDMSEGQSGSSSSMSGSAGDTASGGSSGGSNGGSGAGKGGASAGMTNGGASTAGTGGSDDGGSGGMVTMAGSGGAGGNGGTGGTAGAGGKGGAGGSAGAGGAGGSGGKGGSGGTGGTPANPCSNGKMDGQETDVDCGGNVCATRCDTGKGCDHVGDCIQVTGNTNVCDDSKCRDQGCNNDNCAYPLTRYAINTGLVKGQAFVTWDSDSLDIVVEMLDTTPFDDSALNWQDDSVEIYLDLNNSKTSPYDADDFQITVPRAAGALSGLGAYNMGAIVVQRTSDAMGYRLQIEIPWAALNNAPSQVGKTIGFDIGVNDDADGGDTREAQLMLYGTDQNYMTTAAFGSLNVTP
jgi:hypothetical protein